MVYYLEMCEEGHTLKIEAKQVAKEVSYAVNSVAISDVLPLTDTLVYLNIRTKESNALCVELSLHGFRVGWILLY